MRHIVAVSVILACVSAAQAQQALSREEALKCAFLVSADLKQMQNTPIPTDPDVKRPVACRRDDYIALALPETKLSADLLAKLGKETMPVGQLWLHKLAPVCDGQAAADDQLRQVTVTVPQGQATVALCALGLRRDADGKPELLVYGKGKEPLLRVPLKGITAQQDNPIEMSAEEQGQGGLITLRILGKYEGSFNVATSD